MLSKAEVTRAIERKNPSYIPGWYRWIADETWQKHGDKLANLLSKYEDDLILVDYTMPKDFVETAPGRDEFFIYKVDKPGVFSGMPTSDLKGDWSKVEKLMDDFPDPYKEGRFENAVEARNKYPDAYLIGKWWATFFERFITLRGEEGLLTDLYLERKKLERLGSLTCDFFCGIVDGFSAAKMNGIFLSDDLGYSRSLVMRPEMFREIFKPWYKKLFERIRGHNMHVIMHSCGLITEIIPDLIECGLDVLHFQPSVFDLKELVREFGKDLSFFGGIDIQKFLIDSTPDEVASGVEEIFKILDHDGGGYISGPSNSIMPDIPFENIEVMLKTMKIFSDRKFLRK